DPHHDGARLGAGELRDRGYADAADPECHRDKETVYLFGRSGQHLEPGERVGVVPRAVPRIEAVGDDVGRFARADHSRYGVQCVAGWSGRNHRLIERLLATDIVQADPGEHAVVIAWQR